MKTVAAHFGGYTEWDSAEKTLVGTDVYFDTSSTLFKLPMEKALNMIKMHGVEKFLFGTDFPMWDALVEIQRVESLGLSDDENEKIFYKNAASLLGL